MVVNAAPFARVQRIQVPAAWWVVCFAVAVGLLGISNHGLWTADEPREGGIAREMWRSGSWIVPRLSGEAFLEKPPLYWWCQAALFELFGRADAGLARLPSALFGLGTIGLCMSLARRYFAQTALALAPLVLLTTWSFALRSHWVIVDNALLFGVTGALACFAAAEQQPRGARAAALAGLGAFLAIAFFSKGVVGVGIPGLGIGTYLLWRRRLGEFLLPLLGIGAAVAALAGLWLWGVWHEEGLSGLRAFLVHNQLGRALPGVVPYGGGHRQPFYYYALQAPVELLPWSPLAVLAARGAWRNRHALAEPQRSGLQLIAALGVPVLVLLSLAGTKRGLYLLPLAPFAALGTAWWIDADLQRARWEDRFETLWRRGVLACAALLPVLPLAAERSAWPWLGASAAIAALAIAAERDRDATRKVRWSRALLLTGGAWACALVSGPPVLDRLKSLEPMAQEIDRMVPAGAPLCALAPSETARGMIAFYTDRELCIVRGLPELQARSAQAGIPWLLVEKELRRVSPEQLRRAGIRYELLGEVGSGQRGSYVLRIAAAGEAPVAPAD